MQTTDVGVLNTERRVVSSSLCARPTMHKVYCFLHSPGFYSAAPCLDIGAGRTVKCSAAGVQCAVRQCTQCGARTRSRPAADYAHQGSCARKVDSLWNVLNHFLCHQTPTSLERRDLINHGACLSTPASNTTLGLRNNEFCSDILNNALLSGNLQIMPMIQGAIL